jgi:hypothetical protein
MAAVLIAGGAWAFASWSPRRTASTSPDRPAQVPPKHVAPDRSGTILLVDPPPADRPAPVSAQAPPFSRRKIEAPPPASTAIDGGRKVILPRCNCSSLEALCDCF